MTQKTKPPIFLPTSERIPPTTPSQRHASLVNRLVPAHISAPLPSSHPHLRDRRLPCPWYCQLTLVDRFSLFTSPHQSESAYTTLCDLRVEAEVCRASTLYLRLRIISQPGPVTLVLATVALPCCLDSSRQSGTFC